MLTSKTLRFKYYTTNEKNNNAFTIEAGILFSVFQTHPLVVGQFIAR